MPLDWSRGELAEGLGCYRNDEFFLAHEHWESEWLKAEEPEKTLLQALIQTAAAFHHLRRGNPDGAASLLRAALRRLDPFPPAYGGIEVSTLREGLHAWLQTFDRQDTPPNLPRPRILPLVFTAPSND